MAVRPKLNSAGEVIPGEFIIDIRRQGRGGPRERIPFVGSEAEARAYELRLLGDRGRPVEAILSPTFRDALPEFVRDYGNRCSAGTVTDFHWAWKQLETTFAGVAMASLTPALVETYKAERLAKGVKKRTINRELSYLGAILAWAEERKIITEAPRIKRFPKKQTVSPLPAVHTPEEIAAVLDEVGPRVRGIALLLYDAGLRRAEACTLTGARVDLESRILRVKGKGGKERFVPILTDRLHDALKERIDEAGKGPLFINPRTGNPYKEIRHSLQAAAARAGVDKRIYHHLLRHDHGTHAALAEVDPRAVQRILGHSHLTTTELYTHVAGQFLASQGKKLATLITSADEKTVDKKRPKKQNKNG